MTRADVTAVTVFQTVMAVPGQVDVSGEADDMPVESLDMNWPVWAPKFALGNRRDLTRRLCGIANSEPYF